MSKTLGGFGFIREGVKYDYCFEQSIISLCECCDRVSIVYPTGADDGTMDVLCDLKDEYWKKLEVYQLDPMMWGDMRGKAKLANIQNIAAMCLDTDYQLLLQGDEVLTEGSYGPIREAMETGGEGFLCERVNLWGNPNTMLNVPLNRMPCSVHVLRLSKRGYYCYDDGESIAAPANADFLDKIKIIHYGFVRKKEVMKSKIINMQEGVFAMAGHDPKLDQCEVFDSKLWFDGTDLIPINFEHPAIMREWVAQRM
jgi:hypothetical protein